MSLRNHFQRKATIGVYIVPEYSTFEEMGKTLGKDEAEEKSTYTRLYGLKNAECKVNCLTNECYDILNEHSIKS